MLVLTRKINESVIIGGQIEVRVLACRGNDQVSLGFVAPRSISIYRKEVFDAIQAENRQAASPAEAALLKMRDWLTHRRKR